MRKHGVGTLVVDPQKKADTEAEAPEKDETQGDAKDDADSSE